MTEVAALLIEPPEINAFVLFVNTLTIGRILPAPPPDIAPAARISVVVTLFFAETSTFEAFFISVFSILAVVVFEMVLTFVIALTDVPPEAAAENKIVFKLNSSFAVTDTLPFSITEFVTEATVDPEYTFVTPVALTAAPPAATTLIAAS